MAESSTIPLRTNKLLAHVADEALQHGLIDFVTEDGQLESRVREYVATIAQNAPLTIRAVKASLQAYAR